MKNAALLSLMSKNIQIENSNVLGLPRLREMSTRQPVIWETRLLNSVYKELKFCFMFEQFFEFSGWRNFLCSHTGT